MSKQDNDAAYWAACSECQGRGKRSRRLRKKVRLQYQKDLAAYENQGSEGDAPERPKGHLESCWKCQGAGVLPTGGYPPVNSDYPNVAIIGGGIGGVALAVACLQRGIPFSLYERDASFDVRSQGYGLTLQQASKAIEGLGIFSLTDGVVSTRHIVHTPEGNVVGEWGMRKWGHDGSKAGPKRTNVHIARQLLRRELIQQLGGPDAIKWGHQLESFATTPEGAVELTFNVAGELKHETADLIVGADGIRSVVRRQLIGEDQSPLRYLGCIVILGICSLEALGELNSELLDSATVFQTANGNERIYIMPYTADSLMWQLSFRMTEQAALDLSREGPSALKAEAVRRTPWHDPIPQILSATDSSLVSGYPVYDRALLTTDQLAFVGPATLIGDAAHPMSPFKGQGANQAILDALVLARDIANGCWSKSGWREVGIRDSVLTSYESEMLARSAVKVQDSAAAAEFLHSDIVLQKVDEPRGRSLEVARVKTR